MSSTPPPSSALPGGPSSASNQVGVKIQAEFAKFGSAFRRLFSCFKTKWLTGRKRSKSNAIDLSGPMDQPEARLQGRQHDFRPFRAQNVHGPCPNDFFVTRKVALQTTSIFASKSDRGGASQSSAGSEGSAVATAAAPRAILIHHHQLSSIVIHDRP